MQMQTVPGKLMQPNGVVFGRKVKQVHPRVHVVGIVHEE